mmetsp:Transcript_57890/g.103546  ORF Transcript_57890/g.103546 Transcript_57890/m.103546 type:complete len:1032 (-) Transcript_57890:56-3151(-)
MVEQREQRHPSRRRLSREAKAAQQSAGPPSPTRGSTSCTATELSGSAEKQLRRSRHRVSATPPPKALSRKSSTLQSSAAAAAASAAAPGSAGGSGKRRASSTGSLRRSGGEPSTAAGGAQCRDPRHGQATAGFSALMEDVRGEVNALKDLLLDGSTEGGSEDCPPDTSDSSSVEGLLARIESAFGGMLAEEQSVVLSKKSSPKRHRAGDSAGERSSAGQSAAMHAAQEEVSARPPATLPKQFAQSGRSSARVARAVQEANLQPAKAASQPHAQKNQPSLTAAHAAQVAKAEQPSTTVPKELVQKGQAPTRQEDEEAAKKEADSSVVARACQESLVNDEQLPLEPSTVPAPDFSQAQAPSPSSPSKSIISTFLWLWSAVPSRKPSLMRRSKTRSSSAEPLSGVGQAAPLLQAAQEEISEQLAELPTNQLDHVGQLPARGSQSMQGEDAVQASAKTAFSTQDRRPVQSSSSLAKQSAPRRGRWNSRQEDEADLTAHQLDSANGDAQVDDEAQASCAKYFEGQKRLICDASHCKWEVVQQVAAARGWNMVREADQVDKCTVRWIDDYTLKECHVRVQPWMRVNHFPGMSKTLGRKCRLARNMTRMKWICPNDFGFLPRTWVLPDDWEDLNARYTKEMVKDKDSAYIVKPDGGSQGRGIFLTNDLETLRRLTQEAKDKDQFYAVQKYISRPMLIDGFKFDLRLYVLVSGVMSGKEFDPRIFLFRDGLVRICTTEYHVPERGNLDQVCMHLTNYEVNRFSDEFQMNTSLDEVHTGSKRSLAWLLDYIEELYGAEESKRVWFELVGVCAKTVLAAQPTLEFEYNDLCPKDLTHGVMGCRCFEILGFDVLLTQQRKAMLIEVNHLPSFQIHSPLDLDVKTRVVDQVMDMTCSSVIDQQTYHKMVKNGQSSDNPPQATNYFVELPEYKDFERIFPPRDDCPPELACQLRNILATVRKVFRPVMAGGFRRSQESAAKESSGSSAATAGVTKCCAATARPSWGLPPASLRDPPSTSKDGRGHAEHVFRMQMRGRSAWEGSS